MWSRKDQIKIGPRVRAHKIKAYQDEVRSSGNLTFKERENILYDAAAKELIVQVVEDVAFLLLLSLSHIKSRTKIVLNTTKEIYEEISL